MELKAKFPDVLKLDVFCVVCVAGSSCERPHCSLNSRKHHVDRPLDLSIKNRDLGFKKPICTPLVLKECLRKRPTTLPLSGLMNARTASILDRDKRVPSKSAHPYVKPDLPYLSGFGNPYGHILATGYLKKEKQKVAEQ